MLISLKGLHPFVFFSDKLSGIAKSLSDPLLGKVKKQTKQRKNQNKKNNKTKQKQKDENKAKYSRVHKQDVASAGASG